MCEIRLLVKVLLAFEAWVPLPVGVSTKTALAIKEPRFLLALSLIKAYMSQLLEVVGIGTPLILFVELVTDMCADSLV